MQNYHYTYLTLLPLYELNESIDKQTANLFYFNQYIIHKSKRPVSANSSMQGILA